MQISLIAEPEPVASDESALELLEFQDEFIAQAFAQDVDTAALSLPRGNGKSTLSGHILGRAMRPGDPLNVPGAEYLLMAASLAQARFVFQAAQDELGGKAYSERIGYRWRDSSMQLGCTHEPSGTTIRVIAQNAKTGQGIVGCPLAICDEPGSWEVNGGTAMWDALLTAQGKPDSPLRIVLIGTIAPARRGWWPELITSGSDLERGIYVQALIGDPKKWDSVQELKRVNPLMWRFPKSRRKLLDEREAARRDVRAKARFISYRLNRPAQDESEAPLSVQDWEAVAAREVPPRKGRPIVGVDMGQSRSWSSAVAIWVTGRVEALAVAPGIPDIRDQETRDRVPPGEYQALVDDGTLSLADGLQVPTATHLWERIEAAWGSPAVIVCDRFRLREFQDAVGSAAPVDGRVSRWSEASNDIRMLRRLAKDGVSGTALACEEKSRNLVLASLEVARVQVDGDNVRLVKDGKNQTARDDVAAALVLVGGEAGRRLEQSGGKSERRRPIVVGGAGR